MLFKKNYKKKKILRTDRRTTQNYSSEPHTFNQVTFSLYFYLCSYDFPMNSIATIVNSEDKPFYPFPYFPTGSNFLIISFYPFYHFLPFPIFRL